MPKSQNGEGGTGEFQDLLLPDPTEAVLEKRIVARGFFAHESDPLFLAAAGEYPDSP